MTDRAFCQIKTFCDKGAERKLREEEKRILRHQQQASSSASAAANGSFILSVQPRSVFQRAFDLVTPPIFYTPKSQPTPTVAAFAAPAPGAPAAASLTSRVGGGPSSGRSPAATAGVLGSNGPVACSRREQKSPYARSNGPALHAHVSPSVDSRVMIFVKQDNEHVFTPLHVVPPSVVGIVRAISAKYQIDCTDIRYLFRRNSRGIVVRVDDDMVRYYCNGDVFLMQVLATEDAATGHMFYDIVLTEKPPVATTAATVTVAPSAAMGSPADANKVAATSRLSHPAATTTTNNN